jgi:prevent-host-death family protein
MIITATELKTNLGHYLELGEREDIVITRNGKRIARLIDANQNKIDIVRALRGILPADVTADKAREGRLAKQ